MNTETKTDTTLFPLGAVVPQRVPPGGAALRLRQPVRDQVEIYYEALDALIDEDHPVRVVWGFVAQSDLSALLKKVRAADDTCGRPAIDPRILLTLWIYATLQGIGSARALEKLCEDHVVYRWICGGVSVNYHTLSDFRGELGEFLDDLLSTMVASLLATGAVTLKRVAHDGVRVRAHAGKSSFRGADRLDRFLDEADAQVEALKAELHDDPAASDKRRKAAAKRAAEERLAKIKAALQELPDVKKKKKDKRTKPRVSTTDADARNMRMADGGFRPAYNVQVTTDPQAQVVLDVSISQSGSDEGLLKGAIERVEQRYNGKVSEALADGGFGKKQDIEKLGEGGCRAYIPVQKHKPGKTSGKTAACSDGPHVAAWRKRMETEEAQGIYRIRARTECVHAQWRNRGLAQFLVRGKKKVRAVVLLHAVSHNILRMQRLLLKAS
jgi:transposase